MRYPIDIFLNGVTYGYSLSNSDFKELYLENEFCIKIYKIHSHNYHFNAFFYKDRRIYCSITYKRKKDLYSAIQNLLKEEMYHVIQI